MSLRAVACSALEAPGAGEEDQGDVKGEESEEHHGRRCSRSSTVARQRRRVRSQEGKSKSEFITCPLAHLLCALAGEGRFASRTAFDRRPCLPEWDMTDEDGTRKAGRGGPKAPRLRPPLASQHSPLELTPMAGSLGH